MSRVLAEVAGKLLTLLGYDGTDFRNIHVDAAGDLQVDVATSGLPAGAATAAHQVTQTTALQLIDDLRTALDSVGTDELRVLAGVFGAAWKGIHVDVSGDPQVDVLTSALPTGAATLAKQTTNTASVDGQITRNYGQVLLKGENLACVAGGNIINIDGPVGTAVWVITAMTVYDNTSVVTAALLGQAVGAAYYWAGACGARLVSEALSWSGTMIITAAADLKGGVLGATAGDDLYFYVFGYILHE